MTSDSPDEDFSLLEHAFDEALALPVEQRDAFLREACAGDAALLEQVKSLLAAHDSEQRASELGIQAAQKDQTPLQRRLGPYELDSLLGRGGMGAVYLAHRADGQYDKKVAIKIVDLPLATETFFDRFRMERQILAGLEHPNIARLLDGGVSDSGILFLVMEYVEGVRIDEYCQNHNLDATARLRLFISVCEAVQFAHQNMVVHRDLKPDNVLVSGDGEPHLLDFGTAKLISTDPAAEPRGLTREGFLSFTPEYASPEQVLGRPVAATSDTYSLGVLLYRLLTGRLPYELNEFTAEEMIRIICDRPINRPTSTDRTFPNADLEAILNKALRKEPEQRYQTAEQIAADVQSFLDNKPISARKGNFQYRASKFVRRNRLAISFAAVMMLTVIAGIAGVLWQAHAARMAERAAEMSAEDMSRLSDSLLSELDDAIKKLPGSTGVQQVLVARVLEHLDRMSQTRRNSPLIQVSLINAYVRLANLQANPYEQNLGDTTGGLSSLDKALALAEPLAAARRHDTDAQLALARAQDARGEILNSTDGIAAAKSLEASIRTYDQLLSTSAATPALLFEAGSVVDTFGDVMGQDTGFADGEAALRNYQRALEFDNRALAMDPSFMRSRRGLVTMQMKVGNVELDSSPAAALNEFRGALAKLAALPPSEQARLDLTRTRALLLRKQGVALTELGQYGDAAALFNASRVIYQKIASADPKDMRALRDMDRLLTNESLSYEIATNPLLAQPGASLKANLTAAEKLEGERADVLDRLLLNSPQDAVLTQELASVTVRRDSMRHSLDPSVSSDLQRDRKALQLLRSAAADTNASPSLLDMAFHAFAEANPESLRDNAESLRCAERGVALSRHKDASWLLSLALAQRASGESSLAVASAKEGLALLPPDDADKNSRLRKLLAEQIRLGVSSR